jgi:hypothetical protein
MIYTGIGARKTPKNILETMTSIARLLDRKEYTLRSGGAKGADSAFEWGAAEVKPEIYLPWKGFENNLSNLIVTDLRAFEIAKLYHPAWNRLTQGAKKMMARNVHQVLGWELDKPSDFLVCWTADGKASGGTGQALRLAIDMLIPIYNLYNDVDVKKLVDERLNA